MKEQLATASAALETVSSKLQNKEKEVRNKKAQVQYHRKVCEELEEEMQSKTFNLPKSALTRIDAQQIVATIHAILETTTARMQDNSENFKYLFEHLTELLLDEKMHGGQLAMCLYNVFCKYVRQNVFPAHKVLKHMDIQGGVLNFEGIKLLREIETGGGGQSDVSTLLPSTAELQKVASIVESYARNVCPFRMIRSGKNQAEGFAFRAADIILCSIIAGGVGEEAKRRPIEISRSLDGALFTKNLGHTLGGIKFNDWSNPLKQSRNSVFLIVCICARETTGLVRRPFAGMFQEIDEAANIVLPKPFGFQPLNITTNCDVSCDWKLSGRGGGTGQKNFPCAKCTQRKGTLHLPTQKVEECQWCSGELRTNNSEEATEKCYRVAMCTPEHMQHLEDKIQQLQADMPHIINNLEHIQQCSHLNMDEDPCKPTELRRSHIKSIHYNLRDASREERAQHGRFLTGDMQKRRMGIDGLLEERQERLLSQLISEYNLLALRESVTDWSDSSTAAALVIMMESVPCILHLENRVRLKMLYLCLRQGLTNAKGDDSGSFLPWIGNDATSINQHVQQFLSRINEVVVNSILGTETNNSQWKVPFDTTKKMIANDHHGQ